MRPALGIIGWILLGALATGLGTGFFLYQANMDRASLVAEREEVERKSNALIEDAERLSIEANQKLDQASKDVAEAEARVDALEEEHALMGEAVVLSTSSATRRWNGYLNVDLGVGLKLPPTAREYENTSGMFLAGPLLRTTSSTEPWVEIHSYSAPFELAWNDRLLEPRTVAYVVGGRLIAGKKGLLPNATGSAYVLRVQENARKSHLIWGRTGSGLTDAAFSDVLASLTFGP